MTFRLPNGELRFIETQGEVYISRADLCDWLLQSSKENDKDLAAITTGIAGVLLRLGNGKASPIPPKTGEGK